MELQREEIERLGEELPLDQWQLPLLPVAALSADDARGARRPADQSGAMNRGASLAPVLDGAEVMVCCGSGGVGKTTTAAALGLQAAELGRRVVVVTIDPARRLADALGLAGGLASVPTRIDLGEEGADLASCGR